MLNWRYHGGAHLFVMDFEYDVVSGGRFNFSKAISLDITRALDEKRYQQLAPLMEELIYPAKIAHNRSMISPTSYMSDHIGVLRGRRRFWKELVEKFRYVLGVVDEAALFATSDLRKTQ